jgi:hypothetical protein
MHSAWFSLACNCVLPVGAGACNPAHLALLQGVHRLAKACGRRDASHFQVWHFHEIFTGNFICIPLHIGHSILSELFIHPEKRYH